VALALSGTLAAWSRGGLEQPLVVGLLAWSVVLLLPRPPGECQDPPSPWLPAILLGLLCLARPDGLLLALAGAGGYVLASRRQPGRLRTAGLLAGIPLAFAAAQLLFRLLYYGDWLPNPAYLKLGFSGKRLAEGLLYTGHGLLTAAALTVPALLAAGLARRRETTRRRILLLAAPLLGWLAYLAAIGGDIFPARRHMAPALVLLALMAAEFWREVIASPPAPVRRARGWILGVVALGALGLMAAAQLTDPENRRAMEEHWVWDGQAIGEFLGTAFGRSAPLLAVDPAGCLPYFSGLPSLDMLGLNDRTLAWNAPADLGGGWIGHEAGDGRYVLSREPDLVVFCSPAGGGEPCFRSGTELVRDPGFRRLYHLVAFETAAPHRFRSRIWVRRESERIGVRRTENRVHVPGYLFATHRESAAFLCSGGSLAARTPPTGSLRLPALPLVAGRWRYRLDTEGDDVQARFLQSGTSRTLASGPATGLLDIRTGEDGPVDVEVRPMSGPVSVRALDLEKLSAAQ
jgi:hypothetical protein